MITFTFSSDTFYIFFLRSPFGTDREGNILIHQFCIPLRPFSDVALLNQSAVGVRVVKTVLKSPCLSNEPDCIAQFAYSFSLWNFHLAQ